MISLDLQERRVSAFLPFLNKSADGVFDTMLSSFPKQDFGGLETTEHISNVTVQSQRLLTSETTHGL